MGKRTIRRTDYAGYFEYLCSPAWQTLKKQWLASGYEKECYVCRKPYDGSGKFHLHHRTYKNLGQERLTDLVLACQDCHREIHRLDNLAKADKGTRNRGLWGLTTKVRRKARRGRFITCGMLPDGSLRVVNLPRGSKHWPNWSKE